jgi:hypothetical protein
MEKGGRRGGGKKRRDSIRRRGSRRHLKHWTRAFFCAGLSGRRGPGEAAVWQKLILVDTRRPDLAGVCLSCLVCRANARPLRPAGPNASLKPFGPPDSVPAKNSLAGGAGAVHFFAGLSLHLPSLCICPQLYTSPCHPKRARPAFPLTLCCSGLVPVICCCYRADWLCALVVYLISSSSPAQRRDCPPKQASRK